MALLEPPTAPLAPQSVTASPDPAPDWVAAGTPEPLRAGLVELLGAEQVLSRASDLVRYASDASPYRRFPQAVAQPRDEAEIAALMGYAHRHGVTGNDPSPKSVGPNSPLYQERRATLISYIDKFDTLPELLAERVGLALRQRLQTRHPEAPVIAALAAGDRDAFYSAETDARRHAGAPPFGRWAAIIVSSSTVSSSFKTGASLVHGFWRVMAVSMASNGFISVT